MNALKQKFLNHRVAVVLAIFTSLIVAFPQVYLRIDHKDIYHGIELIPDSPWSPRVREIQDGHGFGNIYQKDGKDNPYLLQPFGSMIVAYMGEAFGLDINNTLLLSRLVLPLFVFLIIYAFIFLLSRDKLAALSGAAVLVLADSIMSYSGLSTLLRGISPDSFLRIARPVNPAMVYILFFAFLSSFWLFYKEKKMMYGFLSVVLLASNFYNYFYTWTYLYAFGAILVIILMIRKEWREALRIAAVFAGAAILAIPYFLNVHEASLYPAFAEVGQRVGIILTHSPMYVGSSVLLALMIFSFLFPREDKEKYYFGLALLVVPFVTMNQQVITGKIMQADHYHWFLQKPMGFIFVLMIAFYFLGRLGWHSYKKALAIFIIAASFATGIFVQTYSYYYDDGDGGQVAVERQKYGLAMDWLNVNTEKESVVFANNEVSNLVTIYTPLNVFYHRGVCCTTLSATKPRLLDMLFTFHRLRGVDKGSAQEAFSNERDVVSEQIYGIYYRKLLGRYEAIPDDKFQEIVDLYKGTLTTSTNAWLNGIFDKYEVAYVVWDKKADPLWNLDQYPFLSKAAEFGDVLIYRKI